MIFNDALWVALAWVGLCLVERDAIVNNSSLFSPFTLLFEAVSAYGVVGLSTGASGNWRHTHYILFLLCLINAFLQSLSGDCRVLGKLIIIFLMLMGRHRGLPDSIDTAVQITLPRQRHESLSQKSGDSSKEEEEDEEQGKETESESEESIGTAKQEEEEEHTTDVEGEQITTDEETGIDNPNNIEMDNLGSSKSSPTTEQH